MNFLVKRTAQLTKLSERTLYQWVSEKEKAGIVLAPNKNSGGKGHERARELDDFDLGMLQRMLKKLGF